MTTPKLPSFRLPPANGGERATADGVGLELPLSNKFSVSWPTDSRRTTTPPISERANLSFAEGESGSSDGDSGNEHRELSEEPLESNIHSTPHPPRTITPTRRSPKLPQLSRALSMPVPSQLGYLRHPHKSDPTSPPAEPPLENATPDPSRLKELSVELADSVQMMIQTMLQISPPQLLDPAKEQFSACSLSVPTSSMSAMLTTMKNLNYLSANMADLCSNFPQLLDDIKDMGVSRVGTPPIMTDFDIGEMLQSVGDSLSGTAAQLGVDLVLYHEDDIGLRHVCVKGDESGISYALSHVVRQVLATAIPGDSIELGLLVGPLDAKTGAQAPLDDDVPPIYSEETLSCTIKISHKYYTATSTVFTTENVSPVPTRPLPTFSTLLLRHLLHQVGATLVPDLPPPKAFTEGRTCDFTLSLDPGSLSVLNTPLVSRIDGDQTATEPTVDQLTLFAEGLKGKQVTLYAHAKGSFAQHLTSYLTAWGMDVTHVSPNGEVDGLSDISPPPTAPIPPPSGLPSSYTPKAEDLVSGTPTNNPTSFIFIDDDVDVLKDRLQALRAEKTYTLNLNARKRPSLATHHRPWSAHQVARVGSPAQTPVPVVVVHFTSISNYKLIKEIMQSVMASHVGSAAPLPEVMIIPKPAGPRRFLTALYTAVTKPAVDPFFSPIATAPTSPNVHPHGSFYHSYHVANASSPKPSSKTYRPSGSRSNSDRSTKSVKDLTDFTTQLAPPSPLSIPDNVEYFSEAAARLGASPSSGLVIQSPDGQPAGIFFHPRGKSPRIPSAHSMERDKGQFNVLEQKRRNSRLSVSNEPKNPVSLQALHTASTSPTKPPTDATGSPATPTPTGKTIVRRIASPVDDKPGSLPTSSPPPPRRPMFPETQRKATPVEPPQPDATLPARRIVPRRMTQEPSASSPSTVLAAASRKVKAAADGNIVPPISVLIVDDNPINQTILSTFMKKKKIKFDLAKNGQEAVQKWRTGGFHLILMDIQMPVMDGIQATKEIRRLEQTNAAAGYPPGASPFDEQGPPMHTPSDTSADQKSTSSPYRSSVIIVALTASSLQSDRVAALAAGCNDFLTKPVSLVWLNSKIIEWGSIKALQMWADLRPEALTMSTEQAAQARSVAERLHVPKGRTTPSPSRDTALSPTTGPFMSVQFGAAGNLSNNVGIGDQAALSWKDERSGPVSLRTRPGTSAVPSTKTLNESAQDLARGGRRSFSTPQVSLASVASSIHAEDAAPRALKKATCSVDEGNDEHDNSQPRPKSDDDRVP